MTHRGKPNPKRAAERFIIGHARFDRNKKEIVNLLTNEEVLAYLASQYEGLYYFPDVVKGEVIHDTRGQCSFDKS